MEKVKVESSNIEAIAYDSQSRRIIVWFKSGGVYSYNQVPPAVYTNFLQAESKGSFLNQHIKPYFTYSQVLHPEANPRLTGFPPHVIQWLNINFADLPEIELQQNIKAILSIKTKELAEIILANCVQDENRTKALEYLKMAMLWAKESVNANLLVYDPELEKALKEKQAQAQAQQQKQIAHSAPATPVPTPEIKATPKLKKEKEVAVVKAVKKRGRPKKS